MIDTWILKNIIGLTFLIGGLIFVWFNRKRIGLTCITLTVFIYSL